MKSRDERIRERLMETFRAEAEEHLHAMSASLAAAATRPSGEQELQLVDVTFRSAHSLKGAARAMGIVSVESICQSMEAVLRRLTRGELAMTPGMIAALNDGVRGVEHLLNGGELGIVDQIIAQITASTQDSTGGVAGMPPAETPLMEIEPLRLGGGQHDTLRVARSQLDDLLLQGEDFLLLKLEAAERIRQATKLIDTLSRCRDESSAVASPELSGAIREAERLLADLRRGERITRRSVEQLHRQTRRLRLAPVSSVFNLFPLMVRDLAADQGKEIDLVMRGTELEVDLQILEGVKDPLIHLVRNAVDHGIEKPEARQVAGKPARGRLELRVAPLDKGRIEITVEDDGAGVDLGQVRSAAVSTRVLSPEAAEKLSDEATVDLLFRSGFSTSTVITQISGHGLGLAIVRERVEALGGRIHVEGRPQGAGTMVRMVLPTTVSTFRGLLVQASGQSFLVPLDAIQQTIRVAPTDVHRAEGRDVVSWHGTLIPLGALATLLDLAPARATDPPDAQASIQGSKGASAMRLALVLGVGEDCGAVMVDEILGDRDVLVKELRAPLFRIPCVASAGLLGTGTVVLVLRPTDMVAMLHSPTVASVTDRPAVGAQRTVLVADDSITTRMLISNILEAAGYRVRVVVDGLDAWTTLKGEPFDLLVSDVDMPGLGGFDLTARVRQDPDVHDLPVVLVTALDSREDKERGLAVGASAYVVKSDMEQSNLLEIVRRLI